MRARRRVALLVFTVAVLTATVLAAQVPICKQHVGWLYAWPVLVAAWGFGLPGAVLAASAVAALGTLSLGLMPWSAIPQFVGVLAVGLLVAVTGRAAPRRSGQEERHADGLLPRREFERRLRDELARCYRYHHGLALVALDLDHFADVEQAVGHKEAQGILARLDNTLAGWLRRSDFASRARKGEYLLALPELSRGGGLAAAERFRASIAQGQWLAGDKPGIVLTASAGIAAFARDAHNESDLVDAARLALVEAKRRGRDRAVALGEVRIIKAAS